MLKLKLKEKSHTTRPSPLSFLPVSLRSEIISGQTPIMLLTTYASPGRDRSPVSIARRKDCLDYIQSQCSAPLSRVTMNSVIKKGSSVPNTVEAVFVGSVWATWRQIWIVQQSAHVSVPQILFVAFHKGVWPPRNGHQRCSTANCTQQLPKDDQLAASIAMMAINHPLLSHGRNCPSATSSQTPKCGNHVPRTQSRTACLPSPTRRLNPECVETFHSIWLTKTNEWTNMWQGAYTNVPEDIRN